MKKKILAICLVAVMALTAIAGASLAYLTDTDEKTNTFTVGNVDIQINEYQRGENGLETFEQNKMLLPIVGSAQGAKDEYGLSTAGNYVDKIVTVKNLKLDAYVRVYYAIPAVLDNVGDASQNVLHVNDGNKFVAAGNKADVQAINADYTAYMGKKTYVGTATIGDISYSVYYRDYNKVLTKDEETGAAFIVGLYLDEDVDFDGTNYTIDGNTINYDFSAGVQVPVFAVGVQASGFASCADAVTAAFGANYNPWAN